MALTYGFYNSSGGDRKYNSEQISAVFNFLITEGVLSSYGDHFAVVPGQGRQVIVQSGWAWFDSTWTQNDSDLPLAIEPPDISVSRIDAVVIETNHNLDKRRNTIKIVQGTPSSNPQKPPLAETTAMSEHAIAYVTVQPSATSISLTDIEIVVGKDECPFCTSILQSTSISVLFNQWEGEFDAWFEHIQTVLSEEVVTNLYAEIDKCVKKADKATEAEAKAGTNDTHWMTPAKVKSAVESRVKGRVLNGVYNAWLHGVLGGASILGNPYGQRGKSEGTTFGSTANKDFNVGSVSVTSSYFSITYFTILENGDMGIPGTFLQSNVTIPSNYTFFNTTQLRIRRISGDYFAVLGSHYLSSTLKTITIVFNPVKGIICSNYYGNMFSRLFASMDDKTFYSNFYQSGSTYMFEVGILTKTKYTTSVLESANDKTIKSIIGLRSVVNGYAYWIRIDVSNPNILILKKSNGSTVTQVNSLTLSSSHIDHVFDVNGVNYLLVCVSTDFKFYRIQSDSFVLEKTISNMMSYSEYPFSIETENYLILYNPNNNTYAAIIDKRTRTIHNKDKLTREHIGSMEAIPGSDLLVKTQIYSSESTINMYDVNDLRPILLTKPVEAIGYTSNTYNAFSASLNYGRIYMNTLSLYTKKTLYECAMEVFS